MFVMTLNSDARQVSNFGRDGLAFQRQGEPRKLTGSVAGTDVGPRHSLSRSGDKLCGGFAAAAVSGGATATGSDRLSCRHTDI